MLIILLFFALIRTLRGVPLSSPLGPPDTWLALDIRDTESHFGQRGINDIIISCFATIFACTWTAVHPNIPATTDCAWTRFKRQFVTMVYALLAPEAITAWALRQRLASRIIADSYNAEVATDKSPETQEPTSIMGIVRGIFQNSPLPHKRKVDEVPRWTLAHGFFLQMGGFMLSEGGQPIHILPWVGETDMERKIKDGVINPPLITEEDIKDRSKGDAISKTLIILQTTWFIAQCITRWSSRLPVTELEVVTLGFAMLNGITYALWWHKPQNVGRPVFLEIKRQITQGGSGDTNSQELATPEPQADYDGSSFMDYRHLQERAAPELQADSDKEALIPQTASVSAPSYLWRTVCQDFRAYASYKPWKLLYLIPLHFVKSLLRPLGKLADYYPLYRSVEDGDLRVPMFYSYGVVDSEVFWITAIIGVLFGSVHLIPSWFLDFASVQEKWLWRSSAIVITVGPIFLGFAKFQPNSTAENASGYLLIMTLPLYIISRILLLTLSLTAFRALPDAALQTIEWTTFIPHI